MATTDTPNRYEVKKTLLRGSTLYQSIYVDDDFDVTYILEPLNTTNAVPDNYSMTFESDPSIFITPGLYITNKQCITIPWFIFICVVVMICVSLMSVFVWTKWLKRKYR